MGILREIQKHPNRQYPDDSHERSELTRLRALNLELVEAATAALEIAEDDRPGTWDDVVRLLRSALAKARKEG